MKSGSITPNKNIDAYVKNILLLENELTDANTLLPFFADGYPGIMFQQTADGVYLNPKNKKLSDFFLYGQTIHPIELSIKGSYRLIVFQLFPFAAKVLLGVNPKELNDDCFDLNLMPNKDVEKIIKELNNATEVALQVEIISSFLFSLVKENANNIDNRIQSAITHILSTKGNITIKTLRDKLHITERTFERQFVAQVGVTPKQFAKIIQFQFSLNQLSEEDCSRLTDVVFDNGFADQSHFIRTFKKFTGKTPVEFQRTKLQ